VGFPKGNNIEIRVSKMVAIVKKNKKEAAKKQIIH